MLAEGAEGGEEDHTDEEDEEEGGAESKNKTFTQDQLNAVASKEAKKARASALKSLGLDPDKFNAEEVKSILDAKRAKDEAEKTDLEKLQGSTSEKDEALAKAEAKASMLEAKVEAMALGVDSKKMDDFITLARTKVNDKIDLGKAMKTTLEVYPNFAKEAGETNDNNSFDRSKKDKTKTDDKKSANTNPIANKIMGYRHK